MLLAYLSPFLHDMLAMLVCATRWLYMHLYTLAYMSMHESCFLVCHPCFNTMKLWTFNPNLHLSLADATFIYYLAGLPFACLFAILLVCSHPCFYACHVYHVCLLYASFICSLHLFLSIAFLLVSCLCLCMYTHGARTLGDRAQSPKRKQKGHRCKHADISQAATVSWFRSSALPFCYVLF